ncbi:MAG: hypothetical protein BA865_04745 [Desulfobacterales bacterium S5133MH4]|nr:MAG: hypothetical protein BA865_04745 [Desulfobacterales bacterium S5133MH4]
MAVWSSVNLAEILGFNRVDAEFYKPDYQESFQRVKSCDGERISRCAYVTDGIHASPQIYDGLQKTSETAFGSAVEGHILKNDLLIYATGAYIGRTNAYLRSAPALASNHVNILRLIPGIDAAYMALVFQSVIGQFQTQKHARGSAQAELYPADIDRFVVPLLDPTKQAAIGNPVRESLEKQQESKHLLDQAKTRVEQLIEKAVRL